MNIITRLLARRRAAQPAPEPTPAERLAKTLKPCPSLGADEPGAARAGDPQHGRDRGRAAGAGTMSDWQVGDLAMCVKLGRWRSTVTGRYILSRGMRAGQLHRVRRVSRSPNGHLTLWFDGFPGDFYSDGFAAIRFRKVTPSPDLIADERLAEVDA